MEPEPMYELRQWRLKDSTLMEKNRFSAATAKERLTRSEQAEFAEALLLFAYVPTARYVTLKDSLLCSRQIVKVRG